MVSNIKKIALSVRTGLKKIFFRYKKKHTKYKAENLAIWQHLFHFHMNFLNKW